MTASRLAYLSSDGMSQLLTPLIEARMKAGLTQADIARRMHTTPSAISRLEGGHCDIRLSTYCRYASLVGIKVEVNWGEDKEADLG